MRIKKVEQPIRIFGGRTIHLENPFLDFVGVWTERIGRAVFFEAKSTLKDRLPLGNNGLSDKQLDSLHRWRVAGAVAFLLWEHRGECRFWKEQMIVDQSKEWRHLKFENGEPVPRGIGFVTHDFRVNMIRHW